MQKRKENVRSTKKDLCVKGFSLFSKWVVISFFTLETIDMVQNDI